MKVVILASVSVLAIVATSARAQSRSAPVPQSTPTDNASQGGAPASVAPDAQSGLQDIIVTAQRTEQSAQKAPLPITVVRPEELVRQNIVRAEDLSRAVPALVAANNGGANTTFFLRGVGNFTGNSYSDPAIAFNYDGVYIGRPSNTQGVFYDLQRVEVLKGPQGTLYGRNATGGAINVIPNRPVIGQTSAEMQASYGNYNAVQAQGALNLPIGDKGAFRLSGTYNRHDGYLSDGTSNQRIFGLRGQVLADLTPNLTTRIAADYARDGGTGAGGFVYGSTAFNGTGYTFTRAPGLGPSIGIHDPRSNAYQQQQFILQVGRTSEPLGTYPRQNDRFWGVTDETNWKTSAGTLTVQAAYREGDINAVSTAADFRDFLTVEHDQQYSIEARFAGKAGPVDYLVGGYYFDERINSHLAINQIDLTSFQDYKTGTSSKAAFGRLAWHVTPTITLTAAGRYTRDSKDFAGVSDNYILFCGNPAIGNRCPNLPTEPFVNTGAQLAAFYSARGVPITPVPLFVLPPQFGGSQTAPFLLNAQIPINATTTNSKFTYRLAADWQIAPRSLIYASYETGYHGGGFSFAKGLESYKPESLDAWTIGSKNRFFDNRLQLNIEAFYWKYKNQQFSQFGYDLGTPPSLVFYTSNVGRSTIKGVDVDAQFLVTPTTRLSGSVQYLDTKYNSFVSYAPNQGTPPNTACPFSPTVYNGQPSFAIDCSGRPGFNAPKWSFNANLEQTINLDDYRIVLQGGTRWRGAYFVAATYQPWLLSKSAFQSDASITFAPRSDTWFVSGFINNIEDKRRIVLATTTAVNTLGAITSDPRTFGVRVGARFK